MTGWLAGWSAGWLTDRLTASFCFVVGSLNALLALLLAVYTCSVTGYENGKNCEGEAVLLAG